MVGVHDCRVLDVDLLRPTPLGLVQSSVLQGRFLHTSCVVGDGNLSSCDGVKSSLGRLRKVGLERFQPTSCP